MAQNHVIFFFDYVDAASWVVELWLTELLPLDGVILDRRPHELRPPPEPFLDPRDPRWTESRAWARTALEARGRAMTDPSLIPRTRKAHELALYASEQGHYEPVHAALFEAFHEKGEDIGRVDVLVSIASSVGLDASESKAVLDVDRYAEEVDGLGRDAEALGVHEAPTILAGHERLVRPQGFNELRNLLTSLGGAT